MRKETSNQFTEGMLCDMNPINTPNTVLTDCINGTIITYNGNEFMLQNDMGNYKLQYCQLPNNYVPVGVKEYNGILYIVSYNPLEKDVEIGSYPSPLMYKTTSNKNLSETITSLFINSGNYKYSELVQQSKPIIFFGKDYKLNPGDEYVLVLDNSFLKKYETIEFSVLDESSNIHSITDKIDVKNKYDDSFFQNVAWTIPGWISMKVRPIELGLSGLNIRSLYYENESINFDFNFRLNISDPFLVKKKGDKSILDEWCDSLTNISHEVGLRITFKKKEKEIFSEIVYLTDKAEKENKDVILYPDEQGWSDWYTNTKSLWKNFSGIIKNIKDTDIITISVTPILTFDEYTIEYDNLIQTLDINLSEINKTSWSIAENNYQFFVSEDKTEEIIKFDIIGPIIANGKNKLSYEIFLGNTSIKTAEVDNWYLGENSFIVKFDDKFKLGNIYNIQFTIKNKAFEYKTGKRALITSQVFEKFQDRSVFDRDISFDEWYNKFIDYYNITFKLTNSELIKQSFKYVSPQTLNDKKYLSENKYNKFFPVENSGLSKEIILRTGVVGEQVNYIKKTDFILKDEDLWGTSIETIKFKDPRNGIDYWNPNIENGIPFYAYKEQIAKYKPISEKFPWGELEITRYDECKINGSYLYEYAAVIDLLDYNDSKAWQLSLYKGEELMTQQWIHNGEHYVFNEVEDAIKKTLNVLCKNYNIPFVLVQFNELKDMDTLYTTIMENNIVEPFAYASLGDFKGRINVWNPNFIFFAETSDDSYNTLLPLTLGNEEGKHKFKNFCENLSTIIDYKNYSDYAEYQLYIANEQQYKEYVCEYKIIIKLSVPNIIPNKVQYPNIVTPTKKDYELSKVESIDSNKEEELINLLYSIDIAKIGDHNIFEQLSGSKYLAEWKNRIIKYGNVSGIYFDNLGVVFGDPLLHNFNVEFEKDQFQITPWTPTNDARGYWVIASPLEGTPDMPFAFIGGIYDSDPGIRLDEHWKWL